MARERNTLKVDTIYFDRSCGQYFVTPDGVGGYWYDTYAEAEEQHGKTELISVDEILDY